MSARKPEAYKNVVATNRKARFEYFIEDEMEAGIALTGTEVKSLRNGEANINDAYAEVRADELYLVNAYIQEYDKANQENHETRRPRKLLIHKKQIKKLIGKLKTKGVTIIPLSIYFNKKNLAKVEIGVAKGKKLYDKRESIKNDEWKRQQARALKDNKF